MALKLFGFNIIKDDKSKIKTTVELGEPDDSATSYFAYPSGFFGTYIDTEGVVKNQLDLIQRYRSMAMQPECEQAIEDICNDAIITFDPNDIVSINLDGLDVSIRLKEKIIKEFSTILDLLNFRIEAFDIFKKWYIEGRLFYHVVIDENNPKAGIQKLKRIDSTKIRKIKELVKNEKGNQVLVEYFLYNNMGFTNKQDDKNSLKFTLDSIAYCDSGLYDSYNKTTLSHLHKAIKPLNQLRMIEDSIVIYRISRAPERRIFYIDVGNLPKMKAEQYLRDIMTKYRNKVTYEATTGEVKDDRIHRAITEDYWLPRREGGRGTEIDTLPGGENLGELGDVEYFQKKLFKSLNVPVSRLENEAGFNLGRSTEITRDEVKFAKFVHRLQHKFSELFYELMERQLKLKSIVDDREWKFIKTKMFFQYVTDNQFEELKDLEVLNARLETLNAIDNYNGKYFSKKWIDKNIMKFTDYEIETIQEEIFEEKQLEKGAEEDEVDLMTDSEPKEPEPEEPESEEPEPEEPK